MTARRSIGWQRRVVRGLALAVTVVTAGGVATAQREEGYRPGPSAEDYHYENTEWNGLSELYGIETFQGRVLHVDEPVDLGQHPVTSPIVVLFPTDELPIGDLVAFVQDGGRLLVADDFGSSPALLEAFGVTVFSGRGLPHGDFVRNNRDLPVLDASLEHRLLLGVRTVVGNHVAVLSSSTPAVLPFADPEYGLLYELDVGRGRVLALGDPSIFINFMLDVANNRQLVVNLFDRVCEGQSLCEIHLLTSSRAGFVGHYRPADPTEPERDIRDVVAGMFRRSFSRVNAALGELAEYRPNRRGVYFASMFLGLGVCVFLFSALPLTRPRWLSFSLRVPAGVRSRSEFEWNLERLVAGGRNDDYGLPLAILKDEFEDLFMGALAQHPSELMPERRYEAEQLERFARRFAERAIPEADAARRGAAASNALGTLKMLARIPTRNHLVPEVDGRYSERLLRRLYGETRDLLEELGIWDDYERRAGKP